MILVFAWDWRSGGSDDSKRSPHIFIPISLPFRQITCCGDIELMVVICFSESGNLLLVTWVLKGLFTMNRLSSCTILL